MLVISHRLSVNHKKSHFYSNLHNSSRKILKRKSVMTANKNIRSMLFTLLITFIGTEKSPDLIG